MVDGRLQVEGQSEAAATQEKLEWKRQEEMTDALGNVVRTSPYPPPGAYSVLLRLFRAYCLLYLPCVVLFSHGL